MDSFDDAFSFVIGIEKGFTDNPADPGNWTGGHVGVGACRGTKYGISAARYPDLDICRLTLEQCKALAKRDFWDVFHCDEFDPRIGSQLFDFSYNGGPAARSLQQAAKVHADGVIGPATVAAVKAIDPDKIIGRLDAYRLMYLASLGRATFADGWMNRIAANLLRGFA